MKARELFKALETELGPLMATRGFRKRRGFRLTFQRAVDDRYHSVWFQCDKNGWDAYAGGELFVAFAVSASPKVESGARREERLNYFLTDAELVRARDYRDAVVERIPRPPQSYFEALQAGFSRSMPPETVTQLVTTVRKNFEPESIPYRWHQDFGLRYWQHADVTGWAGLIASVLPRAIEQMESWSLPPYGTK